MSSHNRPISRRKLLGQGIAIAGVIALPAAVLSRPAMAMTRAELEYTEASKEPGQMCGNCGSFTPGAKPAAMGSCKLLPGAINPKGYCIAWSPKASG